MAGNGQGTQRPQSSGLQYNAIRPTQGYGAQQPQGQPRLNSAMNPASANSATGRTQTVNQFTPMPASQGQAVSAAGPPRAAQATGQSYQPQVNTPTAQNVGVQFSTLPPAIPDTTPRPNPTPIPTSNINPPGPTNAGTPKWQQTPVWGNNDSTLGDYRRLADVILGKNPNWRTAQSNIGTRPFEQRSTDLGKYGVGNASDYNVYFGEDGGLYRRDANGTAQHAGGIGNWQNRDNLNYMIPTAGQLGMSSGNGRSAPNTASRLNSLGYYFDPATGGIMGRATEGPDVVSGFNGYYDKQGNKIQNYPQYVKDWYMDRYGLRV